MTGLSTLFRAVVERQNSLNASMGKQNGKHWTTVAIADEERVTQGCATDAEGNVTEVFIDFRAAAIDEAAELFRSAVPFKWWGAKGARVDRQNCVVECVDILHFLVSQLIVDCIEGVEDPDGNRETVLQNAAASLEEAMEPYSIQPRNSLKMTTVHLLNVVSDYTCDAYAGLLALSDVISCLGLTPEELCRFYFLKATLNDFRTRQFNLPSPNYTKVWADGREDNAHLMEYALQFRAEGGVLPNDAQCMTFLEESWVAELAEIDEDENTVG